MYIKRLYKRFFVLLQHIPGEIYVFFASFVYRLPNLGYDFINNDAFHWKERGYAFGSALTSLDFAGTAVTYHPGVPLLWSQFIAIKIYSILQRTGVYSYVNPQTEFLVNNQIQMIIVVLLTSFLLAVAYRQLKKIIGFKLAFLSILLVAVEPFYLALSRALHTDAMISLFMFISVLYLYNYLSSGGKNLIVSDAIYSGFFAGLAFLTKSSALFLFPFFALIMAIYFIRTKNIYFVYKTAIVLSISIVTFFVFWPAMWIQPIGSLKLYLLEGVNDTAIVEGHEHVWFGRITTDPGPAFYPIVLMGRYSIVLFLSLFASIYLLFRNRNRIFRDKTVDLILISLLFLFFYLLMITLVSKKLDRYSLPVVFPLTVLSAWVVSEILRKKLLLFFISALVIMRLLLFYGIHPNYLAYYSPLIGSVEGGRYIIEPKWLIGYDKVADYFNEKQKGSKKPIKVAIADFDYLRPFANFEVVNIKHEEERNTGDYFVLPVFRPERNKFYEESNKLKKLNTTIKVAGVDYYYIYVSKNSSLD